MNNKVLAAVIAVAVIAAAGVAVYYHLNKDPGGDPPLELKDEFDLGDYYTYSISQTVGGHYTHATITYTVESISDGSYEVLMSTAGGQTTSAGMMDKAGFLGPITMSEDLKSQLSKSGTESSWIGSKPVTCDVWSGTVDGVQMKVSTYSGTDIMRSYQKGADYSDGRIYFSMFESTIFKGSVVSDTPSFYIRSEPATGDYVEVQTVIASGGTSSTSTVRYDVLSSSVNYVGLETKEGSESDIDVVSKEDLLGKWLVGDGSLRDSKEWTQIGADYVTISGIEVPSYVLENQNQTQRIRVIESDGQHMIIGSQTSKMTGEVVVMETKTMSTNIVQSTRPSGDTGAGTLDFRDELKVGDFVVIEGLVEQNGEPRYEQTFIKIIVDISSDGVYTTKTYRNDSESTYPSSGGSVEYHGDPVEGFFDRSYCPDNHTTIGTEFRDTIYGSVLCDHVTYVDGAITGDGWVYHGTPIFTYVELNQESLDGNPNWSIIHSVETNMLTS